MWEYINLADYYANVVEGQQLIIVYKHYPKEIILSIFYDIDNQYCNTTAMPKQHAIKR